MKVKMAHGFHRAGCIGADATTLHHDNGYYSTLAIAPFYIRMLPLSKLKSRSPSWKEVSRRLFVIIEKNIYKGFATA